MIVELLGLNMTALNSLIRASAILAKCAVFVTIGGVVLWLIIFVGQMLGAVVYE